MNEKELKELCKYLDEELEEKFIVPSTWPAGSPLIFVKKSGGGLRPYVDYRKINEITVKDRTPLPLINDSLDSLSKANIYTKIDLKSTYNHIRIKEGDEWKTAF